MAGAHFCISSRHAKGWGDFNRTSFHISLVVVCLAFVCVMSNLCMFSGRPACVWFYRGYISKDQDKRIEIPWPGHLTVMWDDELLFLLNNELKELLLLFLLTNETCTSSAFSCSKTPASRLQSCTSGISPGTCYFLDPLNMLQYMGEFSLFLLNKENSELPRRKTLIFVFLKCILNIRGKRKNLRCKKPK